MLFLTAFSQAIRKKKTLLKILHDKFSPNSIIFYITTDNVVPVEYSYRECSVELERLDMGALGKQNGHRLKNFKGT